MLMKNKRAENKNIDTFMVSSGTGHHDPDVEKHAMCCVVERRVVV